jgi:sulfite reductase (ferredoxin)
LARGVYGQRQPGVQMIRIKIPYGKMSFRQLRRIAGLSDEYASGKLHATTRQDIQIHYVSLDKTPELWAKLEQDNITLREACGNTVRNVTASDKAGIDPNEPFDVSPYAQAIFEYFLRNPICQEMGRKFKIALSSSEEDSAFTFIHDVGIIPKIKKENGEEIRGFKVFIGGGLGAQPFLAKLAHEFLEEDQLIPFIEGLLRVFDRYGERARRQKARLKFLLNDLGPGRVVLKLVAEEQKALKMKTYHVIMNLSTHAKATLKTKPTIHLLFLKTKKNSRSGEKTNVFEQKQQGFFGSLCESIAGRFVVRPGQDVRRYRRKICCR